MAVKIKNGIILSIIAIITLILSLMLIVSSSVTRYNTLPLESFPFKSVITNIITLLFIEIVLAVTQCVFVRKPVPLLFFVISNSLCIPISLGGLIHDIVWLFNFSSDFGNRYNCFSTIIVWGFYITVRTLSTFIVYKRIT